VHNIPVLGVVVRADWLKFGHYLGSAAALSHVTMMLWLCPLSNPSDTDKYKNNIRHLEANFPYRSEGLTVH
jgi:hypothetical protein